MSSPSEVIARLRDHRVLVVGDVMIDEYLRGEVHRVSPEAPVPVLDLKSTEHRLGGAANTAANLQHLGAATTLIGVVGDDHGADILHDALARAGIAAPRLTATDRPTTRKTRLVAAGHQIARVDAERRAPVDGELAAAVIAAITAAAATVDAIVISDYAKGLVSGPIAAAAIQAGARRNVPVVVDPKLRDFVRYRGATVVTPNLSELELAAGGPTHGDAELDAAATRVAHTIPETAILVTRGAAGMTLYRAGARAAHAPAVAREVFDVTGAGDTVVATLTLALAGRLTLEDAMGLASLAAGIAVSRRGTTTIGPDELLAALLRESPT